MALKNICTESGSISHVLGSKTSGGTFTVTTPPSLKTKAEGSGVYRGTITISFSGGNSTETLGGTGTIVPGTVAGSATISGSATKVKESNQAVILEGDTGSFTLLTGTFVPNAPPNTPVPSTPLPPTDIEFSNAGQTKVKGS